MKEMKSYKKKRRWWSSIDHNIEVEEFKRKNKISSS